MKEKRLPKEANFSLSARLDDRSLKVCLIARSC